MWPWNQLKRMEAKLDAILAQLKTLTDKETKNMAALDDLKTQVASNTTVIGSAITLLQGLKAALDAAIAQLPNSDALKALSAQLGTDDQALASAIAANTPPPTP